MADEKPSPTPRAASGGGLYLTEELAERFLAYLLEQGRSPETVGTYRRNLRKWCQSLPPDRRVDAGSLSGWRDELLRGGYSLRTVNSAVSTANSLLNFAGRRDLQIGCLEVPEEDRPELTRNEYLRLLQTARAQNRRRVYLLVKLFATLDVPLHQLAYVTVQAAGEGWFRLSSGPRRVPPSFRQELLDYAAQSGLASGPIFVTRSGAVMGRASVAAAIQSLSAGARVAPEKCNPRCLRKLYGETQAEIRQNVELLAEQAYERLLEAEQLAVGWPADDP